MMHRPDLTATGTPYRLSMGKDEKLFMEEFNTDSPLIGDPTDIPDWARHVWTLAEMGGFVLNSAIMPRKVVWLTYYGPPKNEVHVTNMSDNDEHDLVIPMENLSD